MFVIKTPSGYVTGYSHVYQIVQTSRFLTSAKIFNKRTDAERFVEIKGDAGYGLEKKTAVVEPHPMVDLDMPE